MTFLDLLQHLVRVDAWLARTGRSLQVGAAGCAHLTESAVADTCSTCSVVSLAAGWYGGWVPFEMPMMHRAVPYRAVMRRGMRARALIGCAASCRQPYHVLSYLLCCDVLCRAVFWLQHEAKKSRVLRRVLSSSLHDPVLAGLHAERQSDMQAASDALKNVVIAHKTLRASLQSGLGRDSWGVIQRAFNLVQQPVGGCGEQCGGIQAFMSQMGPLQLDALRFK